jgi:hypothetical protein
LRLLKGDRGNFLMDLQAAEAAHVVSQVFEGDFNRYPPSRLCTVFVGGFLLVGDGGYYDRLDG